MSKGYIGTTRYVPSASRLTDDYGYNGDIAYVIDEANRKVSSEWTKYNGHWIVAVPADFMEVIQQTIGDINTILEEVL